MKRISLLLFSFVFVGFLSAQQWTKNLPKEKSSAAYSFFDYQKAFNAYWEPFNVKNGEYIDAKGQKHKAMGWRQFKRWENFWETRVDPQTGAFSSTDVNAIFKSEKRKAALNESGELWISDGPNSSPGGYYGIGRINAIGFHPDNPRVFWAGTASGGLWATEDGGTTWEVLNDDMQALGVSDIIVPSDYATSNTLYLATGDRDAFDTKSIGLLKSTDGGANWVSIGFNFETHQNAMIYRTIIGPDDQTIVTTGNFGTYKGTGNPISWTKISDEIFIDLEAKPGDFNTLYGATKHGEIFMTSNGGGTWTKTLDEANGNRIELAVTNAKPEYLYAVVVADDDGLFGVYRSDNSGVDFTQMNDGSGNNILGWDDGSDAGGQGWYDLAMVASQTSPNTLIIGGINTWLSIDGGATFEMINHWYGGFDSPEVHADKHFLGFQTGTRNLFEGNDGGIYKTSNFSDWTDLTNGIVNSQIYHLATAATDPDQLLIGNQDNGTKLHYNDGNWYTVKGGDGAQCIIDYTDENIQYGAGVNGDISRTIHNWSGDETDISDNIPGGANGAWITPYILNPIDPMKIYIGFSEIWKSLDRGDSLFKISDFQGEYLHSMAMTPADTNVIYAAGYLILNYTDDGGATWFDRTGDLPVEDARITSLTVKDDDANTVWVTMSGYKGYGVWESTNAGQNWTNISDGLPDIPCLTLVQNTSNTSQVELYAGTDVGVYLKLGSDPWFFFSNGLPNVVVNDLEIYYDPSDPKESLLKAATYGRGVWETKVYDSGVQTGVQPLSKVVEAIYPNPSKGQFKLDFANYNGETIDVEVRSLSGKLVYQNSLQRKSNTINIDFLANGIYVLQMKKAGQWYGQNIIIQK